VVVYLLKYIVMKNILTKLNFSVDIKELRDYYAIISAEFQHLDWSWQKCGGEVVDQWKTAAYQDPANLLTHGWAIQSNLVDLSLPCPPWNISTHDITEYRNTELVFGIIERLQAAMPYAYRWSVSVQPPSGKVSLHSDQEDECTVWIPIYTDGVAITFVTDNKNTGYCLECDGSAYLLDTTIPHFTYNDSQQDRVAVIFRMKQASLPELLKVAGTL
jgi:hypothetical protein